eukprot:jgi/Botrbrau1/8899/Bobra.0148s0016.1
MAQAAAIITMVSLGMWSHVAGVGEIPTSGTLLVQTASTARLDRAADSGTRVRLTLQGVKPTTVSYSGEAPGRQALVSTNDLLAKKDSPWLGGPLALVVGTAPDGSQQSVYLKISGAQELGQGSGAAYDGDLLRDPLQPRSQVAASQLAPQGTVLTPSTLRSTLQLTNPNLYLDLGPDFAI